jgi:glycosyltransferase involved in cell wall biosynthesis
MSVALVSLFPLEATGGGELYTVETAQSIAAAGERVFLAAPVDLPPMGGDLAARLRTRFVWIDPAAGGAPEVIAWADVLMRMADHDHVWVHQYLASDLVFDVIASTASDQRLLFTSLGFEPLRPVFADVYQRCAGHRFVEISAYAAKRAAAYAPDATWMHAAVWRRELSPLDDSTPGMREYLALGRVLPHKGLETIIDALTPDDVLHVVGPAPDRDYAAFLGDRARQKQVRFHGFLPRSTVQQLFRTATALVSASTHRLYDGRVIEQPELLGLVLCEALRDGTLPVSSDVPAFREVMGTVGLGRWTFQEGDPASLRACLARLADLSDDRRREQLAAARAALVARLAWDDYWPRVCAHIEEGLRCA